MSPAELPEQPHDGCCRIGLIRRLSEPARVDLEADAGVDHRSEHRHIQFRGRCEIGRSDVRVKVTLDEVDMPERIEQTGPGSRRDLVEVGLDDLGNRFAGSECRDTIRPVWRKRSDVDRSDREVVAVLSQMRPDVALVPTLIRQLAAKSDRDSISPSFAGLSHNPFPPLIRDEVVRRIARIEIDVVGDRDLVDVALDGLGGICVDRDVTVGRQAGVQVAVERQIAGL
jgi:hypothetical protein